MDRPARLVHRWRYNLAGGGHRRLRDQWPGSRRTGDGACSCKANCPNQPPCQSEQIRREGSHADVLTFAPKRNGRETSTRRCTSISHGRLPRHSGSATSVAGRGTRRSLIQPFHAPANRQHCSPSVIEGGHVEPCLCHGGRHMFHVRLTQSPACGQSRCGRGGRCRGRPPLPAAHRAGNREVSSA